MSLDPTPISSVATAVTAGFTLGEAITALITKTLPSDADKTALFSIKYPWFYEQTRIRMQNRLYRFIKNKYRDVTTDVITTEVQFDNPSLSYTEQSNLICLLQDRFCIPK